MARVCLSIYTTNPNIADRIAIMRDKQDAIEAAHILIEYAPAITAIRVAPVHMRVRETSDSLLFDRDERGETQMTTSNLRRVY